MKAAPDRVVQERRLARLDELPVQGPVQPVVLGRDAVAGFVGVDVGGTQDRGQVQAVGLPMPDRIGDVDQLGMADDLLEGAESQRGQQLADFLRDVLEEVTTNSGRPVKRLRSSGFWVAIPTGQVSRWQTRIMTQPLTTSGAVAKPYSSAPSSAATTTSRPVLSWPSTCTTMRSRSRLRMRVCWVSARPSSHGTPACFSELRGEAPVPPS